MLDIQLLRAKLEEVARLLATRGYAFPEAEFSKLEAQRKDLQTRAQELQARRNSASRQIGIAKKRGENASALLDEVANLGDEVKQIEAGLDRIQARLHHILMRTPNLPHPTVPVGVSETDNQEVRRWGSPRTFDFPARDHVSVGESLGLLDFQTAVKIAGSRFSLMTGGLARLQRALAQFMLDIHTREHGYEEAYVPYLVNARSLQGTGQLPKFKEDLFEIPRRKNGQEAISGVESERLKKPEGAEGAELELEDDNLYLIPTGEVPLTNIVADKIVPL